MKICCYFFGSMQAELQKMKQQAIENDAQIKERESEVKKLNMIIRESDAERIRQKKELDQVSDLISFLLLPSDQHTCSSN